MTQSRTPQNVYNQLRRIAPSLLTQRSLIAVGLSLLPLVFALLFAAVHRQDFPRNEGARVGLDFAIPLREQGEVEIGQMFTPVNGFFAVFPSAMTYLAILIADWHIDFQLPFIFLTAILNYLMLLGLFYRGHPDKLYLAAFPISLIVFSLHQDASWVMPYYAATWHFPFFFSLLGLSIVVWFPDRLWSLVAASVAALCAVLSYISGMLAFILIGVYLLLVWKPSWKMRSYWALITILCLLMAVAPRLFFGAAGEPGPALTFSSNLLIYPRYFLTRLGSSFVSRVDFAGYLSPFTIAAGIGVIGLVMLVGNTLTLSRSQVSKSSLLSWLLIAGYGLGNVLLLTIKDGNLDHLHRTQISWYDTAINTFWVAAIVLSILVLAFGDQSSRRMTTIRLANISFLILIAMFYVLQNHRVGATSVVGTNPYYTYTGTHVDEHCAADYVITMDSDCLAEYVPLANKLAVYRLAVYADKQPIDITQGGFQPGSRMIVEVESQWQAVHTSDWLLSDIPAEDVMFVIHEHDPEPNKIPVLPSHWISASDADLSASLESWAGDSAALWILQLNAVSDTVVETASHQHKVLYAIEDYWTLTSNS